MVFTVYGGLQKWPQYLQLVVARGGAYFHIPGIWLCVLLWPTDCGKCDWENSELSHQKALALPLLLVLGIYGHHRVSKPKMTDMGPSYPRCPRQQEATPMQVTAATDCQWTQSHE